MSTNDVAPIIIKRKKVSGGEGHHGGAWKVAYADFVTAMMAFFMLMWLLNATTETQRKGLADYFSPTIAVARVSGGGDGAFGGESLFTDSTMAQNGRGGVMQSDPSTQKEIGSAGPRDEASKAEQAALEEVQAGLLGSGGESLVQDTVFEHVTTRLTDEGLIVEIFDLEGRPLFQSGKKEPTQLLLQLSALVVEAFSLVTNDVSIGSHIAAFPIVVQDNPAWNLSTERSHVVRDLVTRVGLDEGRVKELSGFGQQDPAYENRMDVRNNRLVFTLLRETG